jgi:hypothetical protein
MSTQHKHSQEHQNQVIDQPATANSHDTQFTLKRIQIQMVHKASDASKIAANVLFSCEVTHAVKTQ